MSYITAIGTASPSFRFDQSTIASFMCATMGRDDAATSRKISAVFRASGIQHRHSVLADYGKTSDFNFYPETTDQKYPGTEERMNVFRKEAPNLSVSAVQNMLNLNQGATLEGLTHLIVVSCTGMYAPGLDIDLVRLLDLPRNVQRICIQFMGCYAAFNALKVANAICNSEANQKVLVVCTELCSIHFQRMPTDDNLLANALFADGSASMLIESHAAAGVNLRIGSFHSDLVLKGGGDMAWNIGDDGFQMRLSSYVPDLIRGEIRQLIGRLLNGFETSENKIRFYALHPGGIKILRAIEEQLGLTPDDNAEAYSVLKNFGNMSSATVVFVLSEIVRKIKKENDGEQILSMGFGPGLTMESMLLQIKFL
jgi:prepilin-type processing-associated H-X9-DG protein